MNLNYIIRPFSAIVLSVFMYSFSFAQHSVEKLAVIHRDIDQALLKITQLEPKSFDYSIKKKGANTHFSSQQPFGFLPENLMKVFPALVSQSTVDDRIGKNLYRKRSVLTTNDAGLIPVLVASIRELHTEIEKLKAEITALKSQ